MKDSGHPRVCMVVAQFRPAVGGAERQAEALARALEARGGEAFVLTERVEGLPRREDVDGLRVLRDIRGPTRRYAYGPGYLASTARALWRERKRYDIIHCHGMYLHTAAAVCAAGIMDKRVVVKIACGGAFGDIAGMERLKGARALLSLCRRAARFVAVSRETAGELRRLGVGEARIAMIPNFVDASAFRPAGPEEKAALRRALGFPSAGGLVVSVGRLAPQKGTSCLLDAWGIVSRRGGDAVLAIAGDGPSRAELERHARAAGMGERVRFLGERSDVADILRASDVFAFHSLSEGMPNALLEAMACGLPCAAAGAGGVGDIARDGENLLLVGRSDPGALAEALRRLMPGGEKARRMGECARAAVSECCGADRVVPRYLELYRGLRL